MDVLQNALGTLIEVLSFGLLLGLFSDDYWRSRIRMFLFAISATAIDTTLFVLLFHHQEYIAWIDVIGLVLLNKLFFRRKMISCTFEVIAGHGMIGLIEFALIIVFEKLHLFHELTLRDTMVQLAFLFAICYMVSHSNWILSHFRLFYERYRDFIYFTGGNLFAVSMFQLYLWKKSDQLFYEELGVVSIIILLWIVMNLILLKELIQNKRQSEILRIHDQYIAMMEQLVDELHEERHDYLKHLQTILGLTQTEQPVTAVSEIKQYLLSLPTEKNKSGSENCSYQTGNHVVNALLHVKGKEAAAQKIQFFYVPTDRIPNYPCPAYELIEIIGNLLSNAFEYTATLAETDRKVTLRMDETSKGDQIIETRNPYHADESLDPERFVRKHYSTKKEKGRGYGLSHVKQLVDKYGGILSIDQEDELLVIQVLFQ